jgi:hypothetical protein
MAHQSTAQSIGAPLVGQWCDVGKPPAGTEKESTAEVGPLPGASICKPWGGAGQGSAVCAVCVAYSADKPAGSWGRQQSSFEAARVQAGTCSATKGPGLWLQGLDLYVLALSTPPACPAQPCSKTKQQAKPPRRGSGSRPSQELAHRQGLACIVDRRPPHPPLHFSSDPFGASRVNGVGKPAPAGSERAGLDGSRERAWLTCPHAAISLLPRLYVLHARHEAPVPARHE